MSVPQGMARALDRVVQIRNPMLHAMNEEKPRYTADTQDTAPESEEQEAQVPNAEESHAAGAESDGEPASSEALNEEEEAWRDKYLRLYAEVDNFRKRTMRERADLVRSAGRDLSEAMLTVLDDFERAEAAGEGQDLAQIQEGYRLIGQKMRGILEARGVLRMEAKGAEFDTDLHEAITQIPAPSEDLKGKVVDVVEPGYKLHDSVLRFAKVVVGN